MTAAQFRQWLCDMKAEYRSVNTDGDCARLLGVSANAIVKFKSNGVTGHTAVRTALACRALLPGLEPYR